MEILICGDCAATESINVLSHTRYTGRNQQLLLHSENTKRPTGHHGFQMADTQVLSTGKRWSTNPYKKWLHGADGMVIRIVLMSDADFPITSLFPCGHPAHMWAFTQLCAMLKHRTILAPSLIPSMLVVSLCFLLFPLFMFPLKKKVRRGCWGRLGNSTAYSYRHA